MNKKVLVLSIVLVAFIVLSLGPVQADSLTEVFPSRVYRGGDCFAQLATGDTYLGEVDSSCVTVQALAARGPVVSSVPAFPPANSRLVTVPPVVDTSQTTTDKTNVFVPVTTDDNTTVTPPVVVNPPAPVIPPVQDEQEQDKDKTCKNKNSGKDGTPAECNAGIGQEKNN